MKLPDLRANDGKHVPMHSSAAAAGETTSPARLPRPTFRHRKRRPSPALPLLLVLLCTVPAKGQAIPRAILYGGTAFDLTTTWTGIHRYGMHESNALVGQGPKRQAAMTFGSAAFADWIGGRLESQGRRKEATILRVVIGAVHVACGVWNVRTIKGI